MFIYRLYDYAWYSPIVDSLHRAVVFIFNQRLGIKAFGRHVMFFTEETTQYCHFKPLCYVYTVSPAITFSANMDETGWR